MPRKGFCASCGREVWLGRDGGCQFGHPASQLSNVHEADASGVTSTRPVPQPAPAAPPPATQPPAAGAAPAAAAAAAVAPLPEALPDAAGWGNAPDDAKGAGYTFDYMSLAPDVSIGDTDCLMRRVFARIIDNILVGSVTLAVLAPMMFAVLVALQERRTVGFGTWPYVVSFGLDAAYFVLLPAVWKGRTLGKAMLGIAVTDLRSDPPSIGKLVIRELAMIIPDGLLNGIVGLVYAAKNDRTQRIGDVWAETVVVRTR